MNKIFAAALAAAFISTNAYGIVANPKPIVIEQPDGTTITVRLYGDERGHCYVSADDGALLVRQGDVFYYGKTADNGELLSTDILAHPATMRTADESSVAECLDAKSITNLLTSHAATTRFCAPSLPEAQSEEDEDEVINPYQKGLFPGKHFPSFGSPKSIAILVEYQDVQFTTEDPQDFFYRLLNEEGHNDYNATGSARDYFTTASMGQFTPTFDVYGPITLPNDREFYGANTSSYGSDGNPQYMAIHACNILDEEIDFSQYDYNDDGYIDNVYIYYAGRGEADGGPKESVWPHSWDIPTKDPYTYDGVILKHYACSNELQTSTKATDPDKPDGVGTFLHEFGHVLGLPDLYSVQGTGGFTPNDFSIMDNGCYNNNSRTPPTYSAFERNALGWVIPEVLELQKRYTFEHILTSNTCYIMPVPESTTEFYLFENRQKTSWDKYLPGHGMLVWHIDYDAKTWRNNAVNDNASHPGVDLIEADDTQANSPSSKSGDPFPGSKKITTFTDWSSPSMCAWDGTPLGMPIICIEENDGIITFITSEEPWEDPDDPMGSLIDSAMGAEVISTTYFDLQGREIAQPKKGGIYVAKSIRQDGSVAVEKVSL